MENHEIKMVDLSRTLSHALRHEPTYYSIKLDDEGWVDIIQLVNALRKIDSKWQNLEIANIIELVELSSKKRHEIKNDRIRAFYGHSTKDKIKKAITEPPKYLFHGTNEDVEETILNEGLLSMGRQYVHLSSNAEEAKLVGLRKSKDVIIFRVSAGEASQKNINFYLGNQNIWLADHIPPEFIDKIPR